MPDKQLIVRHCYNYFFSLLIIRVHQITNLINIFQNGVFAVFKNTKFIMKIFAFSNFFPCIFLIFFTNLDGIIFCIDRK